MLTMVVTILAEKMAMRSFRFSVEMLMPHRRRIGRTTRIVSATMSAGFGESVRRVKGADRLTCELEGAHRFSECALHVLLMLPSVVVRADVEFPRKDGEPHAEEQHGAKVGVSSKGH